MDLNDPPYGLNGEDPHYAIGLVNPSGKKYEKRDYSRREIASPGELPVNLQDPDVQWEIKKLNEFFNSSPPKAKTTKATQPNPKQRQSPQNLEEGLRLVPRIPPQK